jgi:hypothetical protein
MFTLFNAKYYHQYLPKNNGTDFGFDITALIHGNHEKNDFFNGSSSDNAEFMRNAA